MRHSQRILFLLGCLFAFSRPVAAQDPQTLLVMGIEYTAWPDHYPVSGLWSAPESYAFPNGPGTAPEQRAADILELRSRGINPLTWVAHPNWKAEFGPQWQLNNLNSVIAATNNTWYPEAIELLNLVIAPPWRLQVGVELANLYAAQGPPVMPAFVLGVDFHNRPSLWDPSCGRPRTVVWVPDNWRSLPPEEAKQALFSAVRSGHTVGTVGASTYSSVNLTGNNLTLTLTEPIEHVQLWAGGTEPAATWANVASASFDLGTLPANAGFVHWFAYGDTTAGGGWETWSCSGKEVFFTSPIVRSAGPGSSFVNQYSPEALQGLMPVEGYFHHHSFLSTDASPSLTLDVLMEECQELGVDFVLVTDHNPPNLTAPFPWFVSTWDEIPVTAVWTGSNVASAGDALRSIQPNPAVRGRDVTVEYELTQSAPVTVSVYDVQGRLVGRFVDAVKSPGTHEARLDLAGRPAGAYFVRLSVGSRTFQKRITLTP